MVWVDKLSRYIGKKSVKNKLDKESQGDIGVGSEYVVDMSVIQQEIDILGTLRETLVEKDEELTRTRLEWDRTFDSIMDNIVLIDINMCVTKANSAFYNCIEKEVGHVDFIGMDWQEIKKLGKFPLDICAVDECFETGVYQEVVMTINGKKLFVTVNPIYDGSGDERSMIGVVRVAKDVTKRMIERDKLERRSNIYHAISQMSKVLVNHQSWPIAINLTLGDLGRAIGASRVYVFKNEIRDDGICATRQAVYHNTNTRTCDVGTLVECLNYSMIPEWQSRMEHGLPVEGSLIGCNLCDRKNFCECEDDVLVCGVPIFVDSVWWGFVGFDYVNGTRAWKDEDETLLRIAADILGGVIYHRCRYRDTRNNLDDCEDLLQERV